MPRKPIELDDARRRRLLAALEAGATIKMAAAAAGVSEDTLSKWRKAGPDLEADMQQAEAAGAVRALGVIQEAAASGTWQAAAWLLERRYPGEYGRRVPKVDEAPDMIRSYLDASLERFNKLYGEQRWDDDLMKPSGLIALPAEDLERLPPTTEAPPLPPPARPRDSGLAFS